VKGWMTPSKSAGAAQFVQRGGARFLILPSESVAKTFPNLPSTWKTFATSGFNVASPHLRFGLWQRHWLEAKKVDLTLVLKPD
jgi:hypothetical protein